MGRWSGLVMGLASAAVLALPLAARGADVDHGRELANQWCANCHAVAPGAKRTNDQVPSFAEIAKRKGMTADHLRAWLQTPHPNMPNFDLARQSIEDLIAYLRSLAPE
jgi:mono/diheme cytochrome c family protein